MGRIAVQLGPTLWSYALSHVRVLKRKTRTAAIPEDQRLLPWSDPFAEPAPDTTGMFAWRGISPPAGLDSCEATPLSR